eukprot:gnl/Chilomastix_caulleri/407.p2 GENE.gnl/Chilomastix_caulleri/407~~gnl/Chilomastix_caulleri/407.p2  ORF type:complete len:55 (-),score=9.64 gnl/Chilomastix_caulleri/407:441-605(-)
MVNLRGGNVNGKFTGRPKCRICGCTHGMINQYGIKMCRKCFRENAEMIGFHKYK